MPAAFPEKRVLEIWRSSLQGRTDLVTEENEPVMIVYPGRPNDDRGADLHDAVIATRRGLLKGDIEIHVKSSHWWTHRHHQDPAYNRVILHVVYWDDAGRATVLQNGSSVLTLALCHYVGAATDRSVTPPYSYQKLSMPCRNAVYRGNASLVGKILDEAGEQRFLSAAARLQKEMLLSGPGQSLYQGIMTSLGYSKNKETMAKLASRMPLPRLEAAVTDDAIDSECLAQYQARLMGAAGLLPSQREVSYRPERPVDAWVTKLESIWATGGETARMSAADWHFFKVRPGNYPVRRLAAMSHLLLRYRKKGLLAGLESSIKEAVTESDGGRLEAALLVSPDSYWGRHLDFGLPGAGIVPSLLGRERAADIVINVLLPFAVARSRTQAQPALGEKALNFFRNYRAPAENTLVRHMRKQLGISRCFVATARRQQGLLHIYKTRCSQGRCDECPLNLGSG
jgi:hypothetical protein